MRRLILAIPVMLFVSVSAQAATIWNIERLSDTQARITGTGALDAALGEDGSGFGQISFLGTNSIGDDGVDAVVGNLTLGGVQVFANFAISTRLDYFIALSGIPGVGASPSGTLLATLDAEIWAPVGTTGNVIDFTGNQPVIGTYTIVAPVPLPAAAWLFLSAIAGLFSIKRLRT